MPLDCARHEKSGEQGKEDLLHDLANHPNSGAIILPGMEYGFAKIGL
jgi:hypothetical protein